MTDFITAIKQKLGFHKKEPSGADVRINTMLKEVGDILEAGFANAKAKFAALTVDEQIRVRDAFMAARARGSVAAEIDKHSYTDLAQNAQNAQNPVCHNALTSNSLREATSVVDYEKYGPKEGYEEPEKYEEDTLKNPYF
jgi:fructose-1-phosphate kinase PfkB-like protein